MFFFFFIFGWGAPLIVCFDLRTNVLDERQLLNPFITEHVKKKKKTRKFNKTWKKQFPEQPLSFPYSPELL